MNQLDNIATLSEAELVTLRAELTQAQGDLKAALKALGDLPAIKLRLEASLASLELTLRRLEKRLLFFEALSAAEAVMAAVLLLIILL